jgi:hypothetical protein
MSERSHDGLPSRNHPKKLVPIIGVFDVVSHIVKEITSNHESLCDDYDVGFPVSHYEEGLPRAPRLPVARPRPRVPRPPPTFPRPRPTRRALGTSTSSSTAIPPRSCAEQRRRLSLANSICSGGIVILRGSTSSCAGRGHAAKMQSIGCQSGMEYFESAFHLKFVLESQPWYFFVMSLAVEVGVNHCT